MIPIGIERDRRIATLRGDEGACGSETCTAKFILKDCDCPAKHYSTDIACAMELAEEMKASDDSEALFLLRDAWFNWLHPDRECMGLPDAISSAWLKWKDTSQ